MYLKVKQQLLSVEYRKILPVQRFSEQTHRGEDPGVDPRPRREITTLSGRLKVAQESSVWDSLQSLQPLRPRNADEDRLR